MRAGRHALGCVRRRQYGADRKSAAEALGDRHDIRSDPRPFVREELAGAAHPGLNLVEHEQQPMLVAKLANGSEKFRRDSPDAALALNGLEHDRGRLRSDCGFECFEIAEVDMIETPGRRGKAFEILLVTGSSERRESPPMERATKSNDALAIGLAGYIMIAPRDLDRALAGFRARVTEEDLLGECQPRQLVGDRLLALDTVKVRRVPELLGLCL